MNNKTLQTFLSTQKKECLKKEIKAGMSDKKKDELKSKAEERYSVQTLEQSIKSLSKNKNITNLNFTTHLPKFSNPSIKLNGLIVKPKPKADGLLRSGNVRATGLDIFSNSGASDHTKELIYVYEFLTTYLADGEMIIEHLQRQNKQEQEAVIKIFAELNIRAKDFDHIRKQLLLMINSEQLSKTSEAMKQVYFPVQDDEYHLLSILSPSGLMSELRTRITAMQFSDSAKQARKDKKDHKYNAEPISNIDNLTKIGFGGANKQNISVLNNKHGGDFYLLPSVPPTLKKRYLQPPKNNFFTNTLYLKKFQDYFTKLHSLYSEKDTINIKNRRRYWIKQIIHRMIEKVWQVRAIEAGWSESETYNKLKPYQKIWLDEAQRDKRSELNFDLIKKDLSTWLVNAYNEEIAENTTRLGDDHKSDIENVINEMQEILR